jgi:hypothetical protein
LIETKKVEKQRKRNEKRLKPFSTIIQKGQKVVDAKRTRKRKWEWE